jgi:FkbM family methyltransferase
VDVGAHVGKYALVAAQMVGEDGKVIAIEAHPRNFDALLRNMHLNGLKNVIAINAAAFNEDDNILELRGSRDDMYSLKLSGGAKVKVKTRTVDSILKQLGIIKVDWVKIDVEGAEVEVLEGMREVIKNNPKIKILLEIWKGNEAKINEILKGFKVEVLGGFDPKDYYAFYWKG